MIGFKPVDSKGRGIVIDYDCPVEVGNVLVHPGDVIFADHDGVVVIPRQVVETTVDGAMLKVQTENHFRDELLQGKFLHEIHENMILFNNKLYVVKSEFRQSA